MADTAAFVHHLQHSSLNRQQREREKKKKTLAQIGKHIVLDRDDPGFQAGAGDKRKKKNLNTHLYSIKKLSTKTNTKK